MKNKKGYDPLGLESQIEKLASMPTPKKTKQPQTHTPTPWFVAESELGPCVIHNDEAVAHMRGANREANAAFIVRAVNSYEKNEKELEFLRNCHEELVNALKFEHEKRMEAFHHMPNSCETCDLLAKAEVK